MRSISINHVMGTYFAIPLGILVILLDYSFFNQSIKAVLPFDPHQLFIINVLFGLPHIIAGDVQLLDKTYISFHKVALLVCLIVSLFLPWGLITSFGLTAYITVEYVLSTFHAGGQQVGITSLFCHFNKRFFGVWKYATRSVLALATLLIIQPQFFNSFLDGALNVLMFTLMVVSVVSGLHMMVTCKERLGKAYIASNIILMLSFYLFFRAGYPFLSIISLRLPHDITAFLFYMNHSFHRNQEEPHNWLVRILKVPNRFLGYYLPFFAVPFAFLIDQWQTAVLLHGFFIFMHYTSEIFFWKSTSPSLRYVKLS